MALKRANNPVSTEKKSFKAWWEEQPAARRKNIMLMAGLGFVLLVAFMVVGGSEDSGSSKKTAKGKIENAMLPADAAKDLGVSGLTGEVRETRDQNRELENKVDRLEASLDRMAGSAGTEERATREQKLEQELLRLNNEVEAMKLRGGVPNAGGQPVKPGAVGAAGPIGPSVGEFKSYSEPEPPKPIEATPAGGVSASNVRPSSVKDKTVKEFYIPSGTILQGVLLTGVDAPSGKSALKDPVPVLGRIKNLAILPNYYRADVRECFVLLDAVGDLPSERAYMRSSNISCVRKDRSVIDVAIQGYVAGEDGKAGMRGTLVSKQGAALAKASLAGLADGLAQAYSGQSDVIYGGNQGQSQQEMFTQGAYAGASSALTNIADYYLEQAEQLHPVIEISSGRKFSLIVVRGRTMAPVDSDDAP